MHKLRLNYERQTTPERISANIRQTGRKLFAGFTIHISVIQWIPEFSGGNRLMRRPQHRATFPRASNCPGNSIVQTAYVYRHAYIYVHRAIRSIIIFIRNFDCPFVWSRVSFEINLSSRSVYLPVAVQLSFRLIKRSNYLLSDKR